VAVASRGRVGRAKKWEENGGLGRREGSAPPRGRLPCERDGDARRLA